MFELYLSSVTQKTHPRTLLAQHRTGLIHTRRNALEIIIHYLQFISSVSAIKIQCKVVTISEKWRLGLIVLWDKVSILYSENGILDV